MNLEDILNEVDKPITKKTIFKENGSVSILKLKGNAKLAKHESKTNALLILLHGKATYIEEDRNIYLSKAYDVVNITANVLHEVFAEEETLLLLIH